MTINELHYMTYDEQKVVIETGYHNVLFEGYNNGITNDLMKREIFWIEARDSILYVEVYSED